MREASLSINILVGIFSYCLRSIGFGEERDQTLIVLENRELLNNETFGEIFFRDSMEKKKRILIVENEAIGALQMAQIVKDAGYEVAGIVISGKAAVDQADRDRPDLILMGLYLVGELDVREAAQEIRKSNGTPVIFITDLFDKKLEKSARLNAPAGLGFIVKPFTEGELKSEIERLIGV